MAMLCIASMNKNSTQNLAIFYDLETSDTNPIGQILNFCFTLVDAKFDPIREFSNRIKISRLQLPRAGAIMANRIDVKSHQLESELTEREASKEIFDFISKAIEENGGAVPLVGFNSSKFDLVHLRTLLIRNGLNPYFGGKLRYGDLFLLAKKLYLSNPEFPLPKLEKLGDDGKKRRSLSLESLATTFGLLKEGQVQKHESADDVRITIELAKEFKNKFKVDVAKFEPYEGQSLQREPKGAVFEVLEPDLLLEAKGRATSNPMTFLDGDHKAALWIDLPRYQNGEGRASIRYYNFKSNAFLSSGKILNDKAWSEVAAKALSEFRQIKLSNFFTTSTCDIEQDIYRMDINDIDKLHAVIWRGKESQIKDKDAQSLLTRHKLCEYSYGSGADDKVNELLRKYALYRYGGEAKMWKGENNAADPKSKHPTFKEMVAEIDALISTGNSKDKELLKSLREYYFESDIYRVAGKELGR